MSNLNTTNQSKDKITTVNGLWIGSLTCYNTNDEDSVNIPTYILRRNVVWT